MTDPQQLSSGGVVARGSDRGAGSALVVLTAIAVGAAVAVALGAYGREHTPVGETIFNFQFGFGSLLAMKVWLGVAAGGLALLQFLTALWMFGRLSFGRRSAPGIAAPVHRATGTLAVLVTIPIAANCLYSLGFQTYSTRVLIHSVAGCVFYGAFVTKVLGIHVRSAPRWLTPVAGGLVLAVLCVVVLTSTVWYLTTIGTPPSGSYY